MSYEDHNECGDSVTEESEPANDDSIMLLPLNNNNSRTHAKKKQGNHLKEHLGAIGLPASGAKDMIIERLTKSLNDNLVVAIP